MLDPGRIGGSFNDLLTCYAHRHFPNLNDLLPAKTEMPAQHPQNIDANREPMKLRFRTRDFAQYQKHVDSIGTLPNHPTCHFRGVLWLGICIYGRVQLDATPLPPGGAWHSFDFNPEHHTLVHCKPTEDRFSDVPDRSDLYLLCRSTVTQLAIAGKTQAAMITKGPQSPSFFDRLIDWELSHPYRRQRLKAKYPKLASWQVEERYSQSALRAIGLQWPGKPHERRRDWPECLREIGLEITLYDRDLCWRLNDPRPPRDDNQGEWANRRS